MRKGWDSFATMAVGGFVGLAVGFAATLGAAPADVKDVAPVVSNGAAKQDRLGTAPVVRRTLSEPVVVSQVQLLGPNGPVVALLDREGRILYRSDPAAGATVVARDAVVPAITARNDRELDSGFRFVTAQNAVRAAKADPEGFLASALRDAR